jgi:hypothetical protein
MPHGCPDMSVKICPNCGRPVETHEMFNPPRCPVVRIRWTVDGAITSSAATPEPDEQFSKLMRFYGEGES